MSNDDNVAIEGATAVEILAAIDELQACIRSRTVREEDMETYRDEILALRNRLTGVHYDYLEGRIICETWSTGRTDGGPTYVQYYDDGKVRTKRWEVDGNSHRVDGPALLEYYNDGSIQREVWCFNGKFHRVDGPAHVFFVDRVPTVIEWYLNGEFHRVDGPACVSFYYGTTTKWFEKWFVNGQSHRVGGPAYTIYYDDGTISRMGWSVYGKRHREDGPALAAFYNGGRPKKQVWYLNGMRRHDVSPTLVSYRYDGTLIKSK